MKADLPMPAVADGDRPLVSILIKTLNEGANIERCIRSCLAALEGIDGEVIVADSLSDDRTVALASQFPVQVVQLRHRRDRGCGVGAQLAYQHSRGKYLYVVDGDMELPPAFLRAALGVLERDPRVAGVAGQLEELRPDTDLARIRGRRRRSAHGGVGPVEALHGGGLYRREAIEDAGGYLTHPALHAHEEFELALRLKARGWSLVRIAEVSMRHAGHADAAFSLLRRRWNSGYAFGSGELIRVAVGQPYFGRVLRTFPFHFLAWSWWLMLAVSIALWPVSPWFVVGALAASLVPLLGMMVIKRSAFLGLYAVAGWHVFAAGAVVGAFRLRRGSPTRPIDCVQVHRAPPTAPDDVLPAELASADQGLTAEGHPQPMAADVPKTAGADDDAARGGQNPYNSKQVRKGLLQFMSGRLYAGVIQITLIALYVRHMVVEDYAAYTTFTALGGLVSSLSLMGLERAAMRYFPEARLSGSVTGLRHLVRTLTLVRVSVLVVIVALLLEFSQPLLSLLQLSAYGSALWIAMFYLIGSSITGYQRYTLQCLMLQRDLTLSLVVQMTAQLVIVVLMISYSGTMTAAAGLGSMAIAIWIQAAIQWTAFRRCMGRLAADPTTSSGTWRANYREVGRYAVVNGYSSTLRQLTGKYALRLIGATYLPPPAIAAFGFFQALSERVRPYLPIFLTRTLIEPVAMAHYLRERNFASFNRVMSVALKLNLLVIAPLAAWLAFAGTPALSALTGGKFIEYAWVALVILLALISTSHWAVLELTANAIGRSTLLAKGSTLAAVLTLAFLVGSQPWAGVLGLALTGLLSTMIANVFVVWRLRAGGFDYRVDFAGAMRIALNAAVAGALGAGLAWAIGHSHALLGSIVALAVTLFVFAALALLNRPFPTDEWDILQRILPRKLQRRLKRK